MLILSKNISFLRIYGLKKQAISGIITVGDDALVVPMKVGLRKPSVKTYSFDSSL